MANRMWPKMLCHLPYPFEDELLYSNIARYQTHIGAKSGYLVARHVFGHRVTAQVDLPGSLNAVSERTWPIWGMSGEEISDKLTLYPYYSRYLPKAITKKFLKNLLSNDCGTLHSQLGLCKLRVKIPKFLRFCKTCRESDLSKYGETYWRRSHQLAGVLVCPEHGQPLLNSKARFRPIRAYDFADATANTLDAIHEHEGGFDAEDTRMALKIAQRSKEMLLGPIKQWDTEDVKIKYRYAALERGLAESDNSLFLSPQKLKSAFVSFYGVPLLSKLNCMIEPNRNSRWPEILFSTCVQNRLDPFEHALVQIFLESIPIKPSKRLLFGSGPWKCPNPYAKHKEQFPITGTLRTFLGSDDNLRASVRCSCGFHFTFNRTTDADPSLPVVSRIIAHGPTWTPEAGRLADNGLNTTQVAKKMGIGYKTAKRLLSKKQNSIYISRQKIAMWREQWLKLLDKVPDRSRSLAGKKNQGLYVRLRRYDREWLCKEPKLRPRYCHHQYVNWASRDIEWSQMLKAAILEIMRLVPEKRASQRAIIKESGLSTTMVRRHVDLLPTCWSVLRECSESLENYHKRCMRRRG